MAGGDKNVHSVILAKSSFSFLRRTPKVHLKKQQSVVFQQEEKAFPYSLTTVTLITVTMSE